MNKQQRINNCMRLLSSAYRLDKNSVRLNTHNTVEHEVAKTIKAYELIKDGKTVLTEVIFKNGKRADILVPEDYAVHEILYSETDSEVLEKVKAYPSELAIFTAEAEDIINDAFRTDN